MWDNCELWILRKIRPVEAEIQPKRHISPPSKVSLITWSNPTSYAPFAVRALRVRGINFQESPSNGSHDIAEMAYFSSSQVPIIFYLLQPNLHCVALVGIGLNTDKDQIIIYVATQPNEPHQCILTHFNNCNSSKPQIVLYTETCRSFLMSILMQI